MPLNPDRLSFGTSFKGQSKSRRKKENIVSFWHVKFNKSVSQYNAPGDDTR